jgi:hypothetical protein
MTEEAIEEGLVFFKNSKRLEKIASTIEIKSKVSYSQMKVVTDKIREIARLFREIEMAYKNANGREEKKAIKEKYNNLKNKYADFLRIINTEDVMNFIKKFSLSAVFIGCLILMLKGVYEYQQDVEANTVTLPTLSLRGKGVAGEDMTKDLTFSFNLKDESEIQSVVSRITNPAAVAGTVGLGAIFVKLFKNKGNEFYAKTRRAVANLEEIEVKKPIK